MIDYNRYYNKESLAECIDSSGYLDAIVVEGYDGVGKGRVLNMLSEITSTTPYRPDYNLWQKYDHRKQDRWKISGFFLDVYHHFMKNRKTDSPPMLFDRGVLSGAVYNHDRRIAEDYPLILGDLRVLHILVMCSYEDYKKFFEIRGNSEDISFEEMWENYKSYTLEYLACLEISNVPFVIYYNVFSKEVAEEISDTCESCGHYNYGFCRHPAKNTVVNADDLRCMYSKDKEVQDRDVTEMQCV